jgi:hypothetical protein
MTPTGSASKRSSGSKRRDPHGPAGDEHQGDRPATDATDESGTPTPPMAGPDVIPDPAPVPPADGPSTPTPAPPPTVEPAPEPAPAPPPEPPLVARWLYPGLLVPMEAGGTVRVELTALSRHPDVAVHSKVLVAFEDTVNGVLAAAAQEYLASCTEGTKKYLEDCATRDRLTARRDDARQRETVAAYRARAFLVGTDPGLILPDGMDPIDASEVEARKAEEAKAEAARHTKAVADLEADLAKRRPRIHGDQKQHIYDAAAALQSRARATLEAATLRALDSLIGDDPVGIFLAGQLCASSLETYVNRHTTVPRGEAVPDPRLPAGGVSLQGMGTPTRAR